MPRITYVHPEDDSAETVIGSIGSTVMHAAIAQDIDGIVAQCGGNAMCATCHVYVKEAQLAWLPPMGRDEDEMLQGTACPREPNSRLSCQIVLTDKLDGLVVLLPKEQ